MENVYTRQTNLLTSDDFGLKISLQGAITSSLPLQVHKKSVSVEHVWRQLLLQLK